jgi:amidohydrolase
MSEVTTRGGDMLTATKEAHSHLAPRCGALPNHEDCSMNVIPEIKAAQAEIQELRRRIHANPELGFEETQTADLIAENLTRWGIEVHRGFGRTGIVGVLRVGTGKRSIGLRADMDALPMQEINEFPHRSKVPGRMHACGHDGHVAMLLGAARHLARTRDFDGTIVFIFQPAEEVGDGAKVMVEEGLFDKFPVDAVFALHNWPSMPVGSFGIRPGTIKAGSNTFEIKVIGVGAHAALPHNGNDPIFAGVQIINALQGIITRNKKPTEAAVLTVSKFHADGGAKNIIPAVATIAGALRVFDLKTMDLIEARMRSIVEGVALAQECRIELEFGLRCPPTINTLPEARFAAEVMKSIVGEAHVDPDWSPSMGSEDFAYMLQARPGAYGMVGNGSGGHRDHGHGAGPCDVHNSSYDFNDEILGIGSTYWVELSKAWLRGTVVAPNKE